MLATVSTEQDEQTATSATVDSAESVTVDGVTTVRRRQWTASRSRGGEAATVDWTASPWRVGDRENEDSGSGRVGFGKSSHQIKTICNILICIL